MALAGLTSLSACGGANESDGAGGALLPTTGGSGAVSSGGTSGTSATDPGRASYGGEEDNAAGTTGVIPPAAPAGLGFSVPYSGQVLSSQALAAQLVAYDPGSLLRCGVVDDARYRETIDALGGVTWNYSVGVLEDQSKPRYFAGVPRPARNDLLAGPAAVGDAASPAPAVEIVKADVVAITEAAALYYSRAHGVMIVDVGGERPVFHCAAQLPGRVDRFYFHDGHLIVMTRSQNGGASHLLHFTVLGTELRFVESVSLGNVNVLDSRRFNRKLVFYTTFNPEAPSATSSVTPPNPGPTGGVAPPILTGQPTPLPRQHRALRAYEIGDTLKEELHDTLMDTTEPEAAIVEQGVDPSTPLGTVLREARSFGGSMWASDRYFVVTEQISKTTLASFQTATYRVCTASHTIEIPYQHCWTEFETRPNPDYVDPDNSGGDRACHGLTLSACLREVARVSNKTIQVPVGRKCEQRTLTNRVCDAFEQRSTSYPVFGNETTTRLYIYEYTDAGFVRLDSSVHEVENESGLVASDPDAPVEVITTSTETYDLAVPGAVQTLHFQNGYLYVISRGVLQVYAMGGSSIVRTSTLRVVNESLQSSLFASDRLILSDFGVTRGSDHSTLRVIDLTNPAFPTEDGKTHELPGGHRSILLAEAGIFTVGTVRSFEEKTVNALKLGLFSAPYAEETAYLVLATDLKGSMLSSEETQVFNGVSQRLLLPYSGQDETGAWLARVGVARVVTGSIESEGAVVLPELAERVRPLHRGEESYLTFARNSVEWLTPNGREWKSEPILEYYEPYSLYARRKDLDTVELQRLGNRCRLYFSEKESINQRGTDGAYSDAYACTSGQPTAYDRRFLFDAKRGVEFSDGHTVRVLSEAEVEETRALVAARPFCLLTLEYVDNPTIAPGALPPPEDFTCMSPGEYTELLQRLSREATTP